VKNKVKYPHVNLECVINHDGHEYLYFTTAREQYFEWQRGSQTISIKPRTECQAQGRACFRVDYRNNRPDARDVKRCIVDYLNNR
jgi:hypothetical protein